MDQPEEGARVVQRDAEHAVFPHALFVHRAAEHLVHHLQHKKNAAELKLNTEVHDSSGEERGGESPWP